jgi:hypothetical protein
MDLTRYQKDVLVEPQLDLLTQIADIKDVQTFVFQNPSVASIQDLMVDDPNVKHLRHLIDHARNGMSPNRQLATTKANRLETLLFQMIRYNIAHSSSASAPTSLNPMKIPLGPFVSNNWQPSLVPQNSSPPPPQLVSPYLDATAFALNY